MSFLDKPLLVLACEGSEKNSYMRKKANGQAIKKHMRNGGMNSFNFHPSPRMVRAVKNSFFLHQICFPYFFFFFCFSIQLSYTLVMCYYRFPMFISQKFSMLSFRSSNSFHVERSYKMSLPLRLQLSRKSLHRKRWICSPSISNPTRKSGEFP